MADRAAPNFVSNWLDSLRWGKSSTASSATTTAQCRGRKSTSG